MTTEKHTEKPARIIAFYLPQFHPVPENDVFWEKGFTEWTNVGKAQPLYRGHKQPKLPTELGYYDLRVPEVREQQAALAQQYGIEGFCYWHYWFGHGKQMLERPLQEVVESGKPDFPFCIGWANESWHGFDHGLKTRSYLIQQTYPGAEDDRAHFMSLLPTFRDKRYITVNGKLLFVIYHPLDNPEAIRDKIALWRKLATENGLPGFHFVGISYFPDDEKDAMLSLGIDALNVCRFHDFKQKKKQLYKQAKLKSKLLHRPIVVPYRDVIDTMVTAEDSADGIYPTVYSNWDHTPRSGLRGVVFDGSTPELFGSLLDNAIDAVKDRDEDNRIIFLKSWNEWGEGNYIEPDREFGRGYLEAVASRIHPDAATNAPKVSVLIAAYGQEKYLDETLQSLVSQTYTNWEAIVVDDGSPDNVADVATRWAARDKRIRFYHTDNHGVSAARNFAASKATGKYVLSLDGDDMLLPQYIQKCVEVLETLPDIKVVYANWKFFGADTHTPELAYTDFREELLHNNIHVSAMLRREDYLKAGGFDEKMRTAMEDWEFWIRVLGDEIPNQVRLIPERLLLYRQKTRSRNNSITADTSRISECQEYVFNKHREKYLRHFGKHISADMLMFVGNDLMDVLTCTEHFQEIQDKGLLLRQGLKAAKKLARLRGIDPTINLKYITKVSEELSRVKDDAKTLLGHKQYSRYKLLTANPKKFMEKMRRSQAMMPKNWGRKEIRYR